MKIVHSRDWSDDKEKEYKENVKNNGTTIRIIQQDVSKAIYSRIFGIKGQGGMRNIEEEISWIRKGVAIKLQYLWSEFVSLTMKEVIKSKNFSQRWLKN